MKENELSPSLDLLAKELNEIKGRLEHFTEMQARVALQGQRNAICASFPAGWNQDDVEECEKGDEDCDDWKKGKKKEYKLVQCTLFIDRQGFKTRVSPDNPHMYLRGETKRKLVWDIDPNDVKDGWKFVNVYGHGPIRVAWPPGSDQLDLHTAGSREMVFKVKNGGARLVVGYNPADTAKKRVFQYQLALYNDTSTVWTTSNPLPLDPIVEYENGF